MCYNSKHNSSTFFLMNYDKYPESVSMRNYEDTKRPVGETLFHVSFLCVINYDQLITGPQITLETNSKLPKLPRWMIIFVKWLCQVIYIFTFTVTRGIICTNFSIIFSSTSVCSPLHFDYVIWSKMFSFSINLYKYICIIYII